MQRTHGKALKDQTVNLDTTTIRKSGVVADGSLTSWLYVHWDTLKDFIRRITGINNVIRVKAVFTANITIGASGSTVDGYTLLNNDVVLVAGQTDTTQNGLYTWATGGTLTRLAPFTPTFAAGLAILNIALQGRIFHILNGNVNRNTFWYFDSPTQFPVIGTSSLLFYNVANLKVSTASNNLIIQGTDGIEVKLKNTGTVNGGADAVFGGLQYDPATREFYIITSAMPGASGSLTIENSLGTVLGVAAKQRFSAEFALTWDGANGRISIALQGNGGVVPVGAILDDAFNVAAGTAIPAGYLLCNGQTFDGNIYPNLLAKIGNQFITNAAINYGLARPTINLTSANDSGHVVTSNLYTGGGQAGTNWHAFDNNATTWAAIGLLNDFIAIQFPTGFRAERVLLNKVDGSSGAVFYFQGSNNGTTWLGLMNVLPLAQQNYAQNTDLYFTLDVNLAVYTYYRIVITTGAAGGGGKGVGVQNLRFLEADLSPIRYAQVPNLANPATGVRRIIKT